MFKHPVLRQLEHFKVPANLTDGAQILCLPENFLSESEFADLRETTDLVPLIKGLRGEQVRVFSLIDAGFDVPSMDRRSGDKWLGTVWIRDIAVVPLLVTVLGGIIVVSAEHALYPEKKPVEVVIVHVNLVVGSGPKQVKLKYEGDGPTLVKVLDSLQPTNDASQRSTTHKKSK